MAPLWEDDFELDCEDDEGSVVLVVDPLPLVPPGSMVELTTAKSKSKPEPPFGPGPPPRLVIVIVCSVSSKPVARYTVCQRVFVGLSYCTVLLGKSCRDWRLTGRVGLIRLSSAVIYLLQSAIKNDAVISVIGVNAAEHLHRVSVEVKGELVIDSRRHVPGVVVIVGIGVGRPAARVRYLVAGIVEVSVEGRVGGSEVSSWRPMGVRVPVLTLGTAR